MATIDGEEAISELEVGDLVLAYDEESGTTGYYTVTAVLVHEDPVVEYLTIDGEQLQTTPEHRFYTQELEWVEAGSLWTGAHVQKSGGSYGVVERVEMVQQPQVMYNLTVAEAHTFFVGDGQWLVHNTCGAPIWTPDPRRGLSPVQSAFRHWKDHGKDFPQLQNSLQYVRRAHSFVSNPPRTALTRYRANGDLVIYDPVSDVFAVRAANVAPRTMYIPNPARHRYPTNLDYFLNSR